ncbi:MAG TPA: MoxR family ATPase [Dehalococcoidia bacterium]|nr:MoxR family ATPase [SAR202 cluster bacterium]HAC18181.1 ATPase [Dehalococcoidia bacterium]HHZ62463.1 MoxR family ATPase [Dehalococcoidia bacterium]HIM16181.1 MoxR family ATPase [Dehalococcoidia bacterium]HIM89378.1 MoxR family ATPase [Dehalococcoidia bacterium]
MKLAKQDPIVNIIDQLAGADYIADPAIATSIYMAQSLGRPLLIEGRAGVGKTEIANVMAQLMDTKLIRLQCYEGLDVTTALYEWNYPKQLLWIKLDEQSGRSTEEREQQIFSEPFLLERPLLAALTQKDKAPVLLIDEVDRADEEFEAFLLETLSEFQVTIPEIGTIKAEHRPLVILTSNRTRDLSDALRRRCLYLWIDYPDLEKELRIVRNKVKGIDEDLARQVCEFVRGAREFGLEKVPGISETLDWANAMILLNYDNLEPDIIAQTLGALVKNADDLERFRTEAIEHIMQSVG